MLDEVLGFVSRAVKKETNLRILLDWLYTLVIFFFGLIVSAIFVSYLGPVFSTWLWNSENLSFVGRPVIEIYTIDEKFSHVVVILILGVVITLVVKIILLQRERVVKFFDFVFREDVEFLGETVRLSDVGDKFMWQGCLFIRRRKEIVLGASSEGVITKKCWLKKGYMKFTSKFVQEGFAVIACAKNLENYLMFRLEIHKLDGYDVLVVVPHVRKNGIWDRQKMNHDEGKINGKMIESPEDFKIISKDHEYEVVVIDEGRIVHLKIKDIETNTKVCDFEYILPSFFPLVTLDTQKKVDNQKDEFRGSLICKLSWPWFRKMGFRAFGESEKAVISNLTIKAKA